MSIIPYQNGNLSIKKNDIIFAEGQNAQSLNLLLNGKVDVLISPCENCNEMNEEDIIKNSFKIFTVEQNIFVGANDLFSSKEYSFSYRASENSSVYVFMAQGIEQVKVLLKAQKDYGAYVMASVSSLINHSYTALRNIEQLVKSLNVLTDNLVIYFWALKEELGFSHTPSVKFFREGLDNLQKMRDKKFSFPSDFSPAFFEKDYSDIIEADYSLETEIDMQQFEYYKHISELPLDLRKSFFGADVFITTHHCQEVTELLSQIQLGLKDALRTAEEYFKRLYSANEECIFTEYIRATVELQQSDSNVAIILQTLDYIFSKIKEIVSMYETEYLHKSEIDIHHLDDMVNRVKAWDKISFEEKQSHTNIEVTGLENIPEELKDSAEKILEYSDISKEKADLFRANLKAFRNLRDKLSSDDAARGIRNAISSVFFEIYEAVLKKVLTEKNGSRLYHMFLTFAYMDEKLLSPEHTLTLYKLIDKFTPSQQYPVHNMRDWLHKIYTMEKDPSMSEFEQDYFDVFREMKKRKEVTDKDKAEYDNNVDKRLNFEIVNMFKANQKLCHGQVSVYFPILFDDMITRNLSKAIVTPEMVSESVKKILDVDFSAFHREVSYANPAKGIEKEFIMKAIPPDFILMPTFGSRAIMWQEITGRNRSTPGRLILPIFTAESLDSFLLKLIGNFRWELCRTMMGMAWNDISQKSLTSEYSDYIQFFKKNKDLSEEAKEKIKKQTVKYRNMLRDIFTSDYETWINFEAKGIMRLNKVVRSILYKYCPLSKSIRDGFEKQPAFSDMAMQFNNTRNKEAKELESHYYRLAKSGLVLDPEMEENLRFYKDM